MKDVIQLHEKVCPSHSTVIQLSLDGVQEAKSSVVSLDTYSVNFQKCRNIYPIRIIRPTNKEKYDEQEEIRSVLEDINDNELIIHSAIFDRIKRSVIKCIMGHSSYYACEYCESPAQLLVVEPTEGSQRTAKKHLVWPYDTRNGKLRTLNNIIDIANQTVANGRPLERHAAKGIKGKSHFLEQPRFHFIRDIPSEYMHLMCLGVVKRLTELNFRVGENRERVTTRRLTDPQLFNSYIRDTQSPREFGRRCRNLDFTVYKAEEFRNLVLFFFPLVIKCIDPVHVDEIKLWYLIAFIIRSCVIPNTEFRTIPDREIKNACDNSYRLYQKLYGKTNCTFSVHVMFSHLLLIRGSQPLTFRSAFKFESFFSEMKDMYAPGTVSTIKQILQNCYMKRAMENHKCEKTIFFDKKKVPVEGKPFLPGLENNYLIYITDEDNQHHFYQIVETNEDEDKDLFTCVKQGKFKFTNHYTPNLNWSQVGVYKVGPTLNEEHIYIRRQEISGKALKVDNLLITCPLNVLHEK